MAANDLITLARAKTNLQSITDNSQDSRLATLITSASDAIAKYCGRDFYSRNYDELYSGGECRRLLLRQYPIQSVQSVRIDAVGVMRIQNTDTATNQQARVRVTSTGLTLTRVASGVTTTNSLTFAGNVTVQALAAAITAVGNGWSAQAVSEFALWPSADLYVAPSFGDGTTSQGNLSARGRVADLMLHTEELTDFEFDARGWLTRPDYYWPTQINGIRIQYTAGYTTIPEAVQEACAEWVSELYWMTLRDPTVTNQAQVGVASQSWQHDAGAPSAVIRRLLAPFRRLHV